MLVLELFETKLNPQNPKDDYYAKMKALQDLELNKDVDPKEVQQRKIDLKREFERVSKNES